MATQRQAIMLLQLAIHLLFIKDNFYETIILKKHNHVEINNILSKKNSFNKYNYNVYPM